MSTPKHKKKPSPPSPPPASAHPTPLSPSARAQQRIIPPPPPEAPRWTFLSNHSHVLICLARDPEMRLRDVADHVGITERGVQKIVGELEAAQVIQIQKDGRRNRYHINKTLPLRHPVESHKKVQDLLNAVL